MSAPITSTGDMPLISAGDRCPAPGMLALAIKNLFGERFTLHEPSPSKERDRAAQMPPGRVGSGRFAEFGRFLGSAPCVSACIAAPARSEERRVGIESGRTCRHPRSPYTKKKNYNTHTRPKKK